MVVWTKGEKLRMGYVLRSCVPDSYLFLKSMQDQWEKSYIGDVGLINSNKIALLSYNEEQAVLKPPSCTSQRSGTLHSTFPCSTS